MRIFLRIFVIPGGVILCCVLLMNSMDRADDSGGIRTGAVPLLLQAGSFSGSDGGAVRKVLVIRSFLHRVQVLVFKERRYYGKHSDASGEVHTDCQGRR